MSIDTCYPKVKLYPQKDIIQNFALVEKLVHEFSLVWWQNYIFLKVTQLEGASLLPTSRQATSALSLVFASWNREFGTSVRYPR